MKPTRTLACAAVAALLMVLGGAEVLAGVTGRDNGGKYTGTRMNGNRGIRPAIWTDRTSANSGTVLNPRGDENGDLFPTVVESNVAPHNPWVVWSRFNGADFDLAWSRWAGTTWEPIRWVEAHSKPGDDLDPDMQFDNAGRPFISWWREENGIGQVFISVNLNGKWVTASQISNSSMDSRFPTISIEGTGKIVITYETPYGLVRQMLLFWHPTSITDDINPQFRRIGDAVLVDTEGD